MNEPCGRVVHPGGQTLRLAGSSTNEFPREPGRGLTARHHVRLTVFVR